MTTAGSGDLRPLQREQIVRFFTGRVSIQEREAIEEQLFFDDSAFEQILAVRDELMRDYSAGRMDAKQKGQFEAAIAQTAHGRETLLLETALYQKFNPAPAPIPVTDPWYRKYIWVPAFLAVVIAVAYVLLLRHSPSFPNPSDTVLAFVLPAPEERRPGSSTPVLEIRPNVQQVKLEGRLSASTLPSELRALISTPDSALVWGPAPVESTRSGHETSLFVQVPASSLRPGSYIVDFQTKNSNGDWETISESPLTVRRLSQE